MKMTVTTLYTWTVDEKMPDRPMRKFRGALNGNYGYPGHDRTFFGDLWEAAHDLTQLWGPGPEDLVRPYKYCWSVNVSIYGEAVAVLGRPHITNLAHDPKKRSLVGELNRLIADEDTSYREMVYDRDHDPLWLYFNSIAGSGLTMFEGVIDTDGNKVFDDDGRWQEKVVADPSKVVPHDRCVEMYAVKDGIITHVTCVLELDTIKGNIDIPIYRLVDGLVDRWHRKKVASQDDV